MSNLWEWPLHGGEVPSLREDLATIIADDIVYLFGGNRYIGGPFVANIADMEYNDLYLLNMRSMMWKNVHGNIYQEEAPHAKLSPDHTLTKILSSGAVLYGALDGEKYSPECWLMNLDSARKFKDPTSIWTRIPTLYPRVVHASGMLTATSLFVFG